MTSATTPPSRPRRGSLGLAALLLALILPACANGPQPASPSSAASPTPAGTASAPASPSPAPTVDPASVTCESLLPESLVAAFTAAGWSVREDPFFVGDVEIEDGRRCTWGDFAGSASDHVQVYGWAPIDEDTAADAQAALLSDGWVREEADAGVYITENPETTVATDVDGYGITLLFGDGWVTVSDTKEGLLVIVRPTA